MWDAQFRGLINGLGHCYLRIFQKDRVKLPSKKAQIMINNNDDVEYNDSITSLVIFAPSLYLVYIKRYTESL